MLAEFKKSALCGRVTAPPSKSFAHRALLAAFAAKGDSVIRGIEESGDVMSTLRCADAFGARVSKDGNAVRVSVGNSVANGVIDCADSASTLRFALPMLLAKNGFASFALSKRLAERGISGYEQALSRFGVRFEKSENTLTARGFLAPGDYTVAGDVSSQYTSGLLLTLPLLGGKSSLTVTSNAVSADYVNITIDVMRRFGAVVTETADRVYSFDGKSAYAGTDVSVEGDWSNAAFLFALGERVSVDGLDENSLQGDKSCVSLFKRLKEKRCKIDLSGIPDLAPVLFAYSALHCGGVFTGTNRLKEKESDRANAMACELRKFGVRAEVGDDFCEVFQSPPHAPSEPLDAHGDHRVAMALSVILCVTGGALRGAEEVNKSYPNFFETLRLLGANINIYE